MDNYEKGFIDGMKSSNEKIGLNEYFESLREELKIKRSGEKITGLMDYWDGYESALNRIENYILRGK